MEKGRKVGIFFNCFLLFRKCCGLKFLGLEKNFGFVIREFSIGNILVFWKREDGV